MGRTLRLSAALDGIKHVRYLLPKAVREHDSMALACALLTAIVALLMWLLIGVGTRSISF